MFDQLYILLLVLIPGIARADNSCQNPNPGVLVKQTCSNWTIFDYFNEFLKENDGYIVAAAVVIIVFSGIQYMTAMGSSANQNKAKERIISVVIGIVFYTLIRFILSLLANGLTAAP